MRIEHGYTYLLRFLKPGAIRRLRLYNYHAIMTSMTPHRGPYPDRIHQLKTSK